MQSSADNSPRCTEEDMQIALLTNGLNLLTKPPTHRRAWWTCDSRAGRRQTQAHTISHNIRIAASVQWNTSGLHAGSPPVDVDRAWQMLSTRTADIYGPLQCRLATIYSRPAWLNMLSPYCGINNGEHWGGGRPSRDRNKHAFEICCKPITHWGHLYVL